MSRPRILIVVDVPGWALDRTADNVIRHLGHRFAFTKVYNADAREKIIARDFDLLYIAYWRQLTDAGISVQLPSACISGVRSHFKWDEGFRASPGSEVVAAVRQFAAINVPSRILYDVFAPLHPAVFYTPHGVDAEIFRPAAIRPFSPSGKLVLGWAGSRSNHPGKRGLEDFLLPALKGLKGVELRLACREDRWRNQGEMVAFYQGLDACICCSRTEGGPHPLLEAAACGVPVISTRVGIAPELIRHEENGLLTDRTTASIRAAITRLRDDHDLRAAMGEAARQEILTHWRWELQARHYIPFLEYALALGRGAGSGIADAVLPTGSSSVP